VVEIEAATTGDSLHVSQDCVALGECTFGSALVLPHLSRQFKASKRRTDMSGVLRYCFLQTLALCLIVALGLVGPANSWRAARAAEDSSATATKEKADEKSDDAVSKDKDKKSDADADTKSDKDEKAESKNGKPKDEAAVKDKKDSESIATDKDKDQVKADATAEKNSKPKATAEKKGEKVRLALLVLKDELAETAGQVGPFGETKLDLRELVGRLERAAKDDDIKGVVLDIQNPGMGRAKVDELRAAITRFRASGKKAYAQMDTGMPADYLIACACNEIVMPESGMLLLPGIYAEATFYKGLLGKIGVEADFIHMGAYKGAAEPLTREKFSEPVRENMTALIDSLYDEMVSTIVKDRPLSIAQAKAAIDTGLMTAKKAKELGLIDRIAYSDTLRDELAVSYKAEPLVYVKNYGQKKVDTDFSGPMGLMKLMQVMMGGSSSSKSARGKKIAVVYAVGPIMTGKSENDPFGGEVMGSTTIVEALRKANEDKNVVAIVLRIDSPGGSALASDLIWHETQVIKKPIIASMSDVAASGGYYIAMGADKIIASPGTVTGSIGVVGGKLAIRGLYDKLGITTETIERGRNSGIFGSSGKFTDSQRAAITSMMEDTYGQFTTKAAEGRKMPVEKLRELAGGRVYTGRQALDNGLVDQLGTLQDAVAEAKQMAGIDRDADVKLEVLPEPTNFFESLFGDMDAEEEVSFGGPIVRSGLKELKHVSPEMIDLARRAYRLRAVFDQPAAFVMPFDLDVR
jgi:protease IV